jgi:F/Y rich C-terminus
VFAEIARHILEPLEKMRRENDLVKVFPTFLTGEDLFGLTEPTVQKIIESVLAFIEFLHIKHLLKTFGLIFHLTVSSMVSSCACLFGSTFIISSVIANKYTHILVCCLMYCSCLELRCCRITISDMVDRLFTSCHWPSIQLAALGLNHE